MTKFILVRAPKNEPMMFYNAALGEWMLTSTAATRMHRIVAKDLFEDLRDHGSIKIFPVMVDRR